MIHAKEKLLIIRHPRSAGNIRTSDDHDCEITEFGYRQARTVAKFLRDHFDLYGFSLFTSPWLRCLEMADAIQRTVRSRHNLMPFTVLPDLREYINHGWREVELLLRRHEYRSMNWDMFSNQTEKMTFKDEFNEQLIARVRRLHDFLPQKSVVITHGLPALTLMHVATKDANYIPIWDYSIDNASMTLIVNGKVVWLGRNLFAEIDEDPHDKPKVYDDLNFLLGTK